MAGVLKGGELGLTLSAEEAERRMDALCVDDESGDWVESDWLGTADLATALKVSHGKIRLWRRTKVVIALRMGGRIFVYPLRQFIGGTPVMGLAAVAEHFAAPEDAWEWVVTFNRMTGKRPPIDALREGDIQAAVSAAKNEDWLGYV